MEVTRLENIRDPLLSVWSWTQALGDEEPWVFELG